MIAIATKKSPRNTGRALCVKHGINHQWAGHNRFGNWYNHPGQDPAHYPAVLTTPKGYLEFATAEAFNDWVECYNITCTAKYVHIPFRSGIESCIGFVYFSDRKEYSVLTLSVEDVIAERTLRSMGALGWTLLAVDGGRAYYERNQIDEEGK